MKRIILFFAVLFALVATATYAADPGGWVNGKLHFPDTTEQPTAANESKVIQYVEDGGFTRAVVLPAQVLWIINDGGTGNVNEGVNLYYTESRAVLAAVDGGFMRTADFAALAADASVSHAASAAAVDNGRLNGALTVNGGLTVDGGVTINKGTIIVTSDGFGNKVIIYDADGGLAYEMRTGEAQPNTQLNNYSLYMGTGAGAAAGGSLSNTVVGNIAYNSSSGKNNAIFGAGAAYASTGGNNNSYYGEGAGYSDNGSYNTLLGNECFDMHATGDKNVVIGYIAAETLANGSTPLTSAASGVYIGAECRAGSSDGESNAIVIGAAAIGEGSNAVVLGNDSITSTALKGAVKIGVATTYSSPIKIEMKSANTTDATKTAIWTSPAVATEESYKVNADCMGTDALDGGVGLHASYEISTMCHSTSGVLACDTITSARNIEDDPAWDCTIEAVNAGSDTITVRVTGAVGANVYWSCDITTRKTVR